MEEKKEKGMLTKKQKAGRTILFFGVFATSLFYILWRAFFTLPLHHGVVSLIVGIALLVAETLTVVETYLHFYNARHVVIPDMPAIEETMYPDVDVMICTHNEDANLMFKTINGCVHMDYPDKSKVHIYVCDDNCRDEIRALAAEFEVNYVACEDNKHAKAGNLNHALQQATSPYVAIFDADMIPTRNFLLETVPYFFLNEMIQEDGVWRRRTQEELDEVKDEKPLAYVQTHQSFYNADVLQKNLYLEKDAPNEQDYFYRAVNVARSRNSSAAFAGSNTVFLRKAIDDAGGIATYSITEDLATSVEILENGYKSLAVDKELAHGLSPDDAKSFIKQRQRWSRGSAQVVPTMRFIKNKTPFAAKVNFFVSYLYWWTFVQRFIFILCPILYGLFGVAVADTSLLNLLLVWLPYYFIYNAGLRVMSGQTINALWSNVIDTIQFPYMMWPVIAGTLHIPNKKFWVTPKNKVSGRNSSLRLALPHIVLIVLSAFSIITCVRHIFVNRYEGAIIVLFWLLYNLFALCVSVIYYFGRVDDGAAEQIPSNAEVSLSVKGGMQNVAGTATTISDDGMVVAVEHPDMLMMQNNIPLKISENGYTAEMTAQLLGVDKKNNCKFSLVEIDTPNRRAYMQLVYDRDHSFCRTVNIYFSKFVTALVGGFLKSLRKETLRKETLRYDKSQPSDFTVETLEVGRVEVFRFEDQTLVLHGKKLPDKLTVVLGDETCRCEKVENEASLRDRSWHSYQIVSVASPTKSAQVALSGV